MREPTDECARSISGALAACVEPPRLSPEIVACVIVCLQIAIALLAQLSLTFRSARVNFYD